MNVLPGQTPHVSVIVPCYNEEQNLKNGALDEVHRFLARQEYPWEAIVVNDESTDGSRPLIERFIEGRHGFSLIDIPHGGKPLAVWAGIRKAKGEIVLFADMDQSTPIEELDKLLPWYERGFDVVIGSRGDVREGSSPLRKAGSYVFGRFRRSFLLRDIRDTQCGFKSCRRGIAMEIFPRLHAIREARAPAGWKVTAYDVELLFLMEMSGYRIKEVEVSWFNRDQSDTKRQGKERSRYIKESVEMAREVLRIRLNQARGYYN